MQPEHINADNPLQQRSDLTQWVNDMLNAVTPFIKNNHSGVDLANFTTHYGQRIANMEAFSRLLWGVTPLLAGGQEPEQLSLYIQAIKNGTHPAHPEYWGEIGHSDQRVVEMAAYGLLLALAHQPLLAHFNELEKHHLWQWLKQSETATIPDNNWHFFPILVQVGFHHAGMPVNHETIERHFAAMEHYWLGDGWYSDGPERPRDYYISMGFHFYGLIYSQLMKEVDPQRCATLRERATVFAADFIHFFDDDGAAIPFGRSLTYRFAQAAFWSAAAFTGLDVYSPGILKGLVLRHLRWWQQQQPFDRDGVLSVGYSYPNLIMAEDYNAPGSPYWALKTVLVLALGENSDFWQAKEAPLPPRETPHAIPKAAQILVHQPNHLWMLTSGQLERNNFVNTEAKYCKFAYSTRYAFNVERGRFGLAHASPDSMLLLSEKDNYWRGRRECQQVSVHENYIYSRWLPWNDVTVDSWLVALGDWQVRVHQLQTARELDCAEGGFSINSRPLPEQRLNAGTSLLTGEHDTSAIVCLSEKRRQGEVVFTPPNSNLLFADRAAVPVLRGELSPGTHLLICAVWAGDSQDFNLTRAPEVSVEQGVIHLTSATQKTQFPLTEQPKE
ncbi:DUF2264 domain-containing protein [Scandinavium goeteborgense]|uniref:DUF2264 domain-containing protein n=1 Tax=Scandinavium goeteborgense TaxID=1851514 RepID=A0A4R6EN69_SCAGO|nr:DUF2264 domain-containing protein [Scandinavium goeteborgense]TDN60635.1 hypothetical protein EC847_102209 [Scandinavium goeteborgense]